MYKNMEQFMVYAIDNLDITNKYLDKRIYDLNTLETRSLKYILEVYNENKCIPKQIFDRLVMNEDLCMYASSLDCRMNDDKQNIGNLNYYTKLLLKEYIDNETEKLLVMFRDKKITQEDFEKKYKELKKYTNVDNSIKLLNAGEINVDIKEKEYVLSGIRDLDYYVKGFALGELNVWSGSNASAKSTLLNQLAIESINQNYNTFVYSGELTRERLMQWLYLQLAGENIVEANGIYKPTENAMNKMQYWIDNKLFIYDNELGNKEEDIIKYIIYAIENANVKVIILDNLMSMQLESDNTYVAQSNLVKKLSNICKKYNVVIHFVCHPRKATSFLRKNDISGTADLTNIADNVFITHRIGTDFTASFEDTYKVRFNNDNQYTNVVEICKNREYGVQDRFCGMYFDTRNRRLKNSPNEMKKYNWEK